MRILWAVLVFLSSCSVPVTLYTDETFRNAAPEVVRAWKSVAPWRDARTEDLPRGTGLKELTAKLDANTSIALIGVALTAQDLDSLTRSHPKLHLLFLGQGTDAAFRVTRADAWSAVARRAADSGPAQVLYPGDLLPAEKQAFETTWKEAGGGVLTEFGAPNAAAPKQVFQWASNELPPEWQSLPLDVSVHGNPGLARRVGTSGLTWAIKQEGLAEFLWAAAVSPIKQTHFLPLETVFERR